MDRGNGGGCSCLLNSIVRFVPDRPWGGVGTIGVAGAGSRGRKNTEWRELPYYINPGMCAYYELHPERFKPTGRGEEIEIEGFAAFLKDDDFVKEDRSFVRSRKIMDPWGEPVHFVQDLNMDGYFEAAGERWGNPFFDLRDSPDEMDAVEVSRFLRVRTARGTNPQGFDSFRALPSGLTTRTFYSPEEQFDLHKCDIYQLRLQFQVFERIEKNRRENGFSFAAI